MVINNRFKIIEEEVNPCKNDDDRVIVFIKVIDRTSGIEYHSKTDVDKDFMEYHKKDVLREILLTLADQIKNKEVKPIDEVPELMMQ